MNTGGRQVGPDRPNEPEPLGLDAIQSQQNASATATVEPELYAGLAEWLDRDLARLEALYKGWATAGYGQWRRSVEGRR